MFAAEHKFPGLNCLLPVPGCQGFAQLKLHSSFPRILLLIPALRARCPRHPFAALGQPELRCARQPLPRRGWSPAPASALAGWFHGRSQFVCSLLTPSRARGMFHPSPRVTTAAPCRRSRCPSEPGLAGGGCPSCLGAFQGQRDGGVEISAGDSAVLGLHRGQAEGFPSLRGSAERTELQHWPPAHRALTGAVGGRK